MTEGTGAGEPRQGSTPADATPTTGMPRWVKITLIVVAAMIALAVVVKVTGLGGEHGPGRHMNGRMNHGAPSSVEPAP